MQYRPNLPVILNNISFSIQEGQKVGIVGRSGAGKSSIVLALYRLIEPESDCSYKIDGHDALKMGLHSLRKHISLIPQTPFVFNGTIRQNIDPTATVSDE